MEKKLYKGKITKIFGSQMFPKEFNLVGLDEDGELYVWRPAEEGGTYFGIFGEIKREVREQGWYHLEDKHRNES